MKKYRFSGGLFVTPLLITTSCVYLTNNVKNTHSLEQARHAQSQLLAIQTTLDKKSSPLLRSGLLGLLWLWTLARFYSIEKRRRIPRWQVGDLALLKIICLEDCEGVKSTFDSFDFLTGLQEYF